MNNGPETNNTTAEIVATEPTGLVQINLGMLQASNSKEMLAAGAEIAGPLKQFIQDKGLFIFLGGDVPHVFATGWSTMITMLGLFPQVISIKSEPTKDGWGNSYVADVGLVRASDGKMICSGSAECGGIDEPDWHEKPKYVWEGPDNDRRKKQVGMQPVSGNSRRSMAQTRAAAKAARLGFAWIMELAGYSPTPAEEMPADDSVDPDAPPPKEYSKEETRKRAGFGAENRRKQEKAEKKEIEIKQMPAKYDFTCKLCDGQGKKGEQIAFFVDAKGNGHTSHWNCWLDKGLADGEERA